MKTKTFLLLIASLFGLAWSIPARATELPRDPAAVPEGLSGSDWSSIRSAYEAGRHHFFQQADGSHVARNPSLGWRMDFDARGFTATDGTWTWGLELTSSSSFYSSSSSNRLQIQRTPHLTEWFINDQRGLEQGWTLSAPAEIHLRVRGDLKPTVTAQSIDFGGQITYSGLKAWDADGKTVPTHFEATPEGFAVRYDDAGARYPLTIDPLAQQAYLKASNTGANDAFGLSVAVAGDTVVVAAPGEDSNATGINGNQADNTAVGSGAVYVFVRSGSLWSQQAYLKASNTDAGDNFGGSVAISGDTVVVGAVVEDSSATGVNGNQADNSATAAGAAYVFTRSGYIWTQQAYLKASNTGAGDVFGGSVAISGDTVVVGASGEASNATGVNGNQTDNSSPEAGAAYVFVRSGKVWSQQAYLKASNTEASDVFGVVAASGDTVVVGASGEASNATGVNGNQANNTVPRAGAAYVFTRSGTTWSQQAYLKASAVDISNFFGGSVAISGDTVVVGSNGESSNATGVNGNPANNSAILSGAAYVFVRTGTQWSQQAYLKASNTGTGDNFGFSVAVSGDTVVVGSNQEDSAAGGINGEQFDEDSFNAGAAYVFVRSGTQWSQQAYLKASNTGGSDRFGWAVAVSGDTVLVGAPFEDCSATGVLGNPFDDGVTDAGSAYIYRGFGTVLPSLARTTASAPGAADIAYSTPGFASVNGSGRALFDQTLSGTGASSGRNRAVFSSLASIGSTVTVDLAFQTGAPLAGVGGFGANAKAIAVTSPVCNLPISGLFLATASGTGVTSTNNRLLFGDNGSYIVLLRRTGLAVTELGNAEPSAFTEVLQSHDQDLVVVSHVLKVSTAPTPDVTTGNDSGLLLLNNAGALLFATPPREGDDTLPKYGPDDGTLGQFTGRAAGGVGDTIHFGALFKPAAGAAVQGLYFTNATGTITGRSALAGQVAPGAFPATAKFASFPAFTQIGSNALYRATLSGAAAANNEGLWEGGTLRALKGDNIGGGITIASFIRFWPVGSDQIVLQVTLSGTGVTSTSNSALLLRQANGTYLVLLRTGDRAPGAGPAKVLAIQAVDVDPENGYYVVTGSLSGAATTNNQALWAGRTKTLLSDDGSNKELRLPTLRLRKGDRYLSTATPLGTIKSLTLKPAVDATGAGGRGLAQAVGSGGYAVVYILTDPSVTELVRLKL